MKSGNLANISTGETSNVKEFIMDKTLRENTHIVVASLGKGKSELDEGNLEKKESNDFLDIAFAGQSKANKKCYAIISA